MTTKRLEGDVDFAPIDPACPPPYQSGYASCYQWGYQAYPTYYCYPATTPGPPPGPPPGPIFLGEAVEVKSDDEGSAIEQCQTSISSSTHDSSPTIPAGCYIPYHPTYSNHDEPQHGIHMCAECKQARSIGYHRDHPIAPGEKTEHTLCRKCKRRAKVEGLDGTKECTDSVHIKFYDGSDDEIRGRSVPRESYRVVRYRTDPPATSEVRKSTRAGEASEAPNSRATIASKKATVSRSEQTQSTAESKEQRSKPEDINHNTCSRTRVEVRERSIRRRHRDQSPDSAGLGPWHYTAVIRERSCTPKPKPKAPTLPHLEVAHASDVPFSSPGSKCSHSTKPVTQRMKSSATTVTVTSTKKAEAASDEIMKSSSKQSTARPHDAFINSNKLSTAEARLAAHPSAFRYGRYVARAELVDPSNKSKSIAAPEAEPATQPSEGYYSIHSVHEYRHHHRHRSHSRRRKHSRSHATSRAVISALDGQADSEASSVTVKYTDSVGSASTNNEERETGRALKKSEAPVARSAKLGSRSASRTGVARESLDSIRALYGGSRVKFESEANAARRRSLMAEESMVTISRPSEQSKSQKFGIGAFVRDEEDDDRRDPDKAINEWLSKTPPPSPAVEPLRPDTTNAFRHVKAPSKLSSPTKRSESDLYRAPPNHPTERSTLRPRVSRDQSPSPRRRGRTLHRDKSSTSVNQPPLTRRVSFPAALPIEPRSSCRRYHSPPPHLDPHQEFESESTEVNGICMRRKPSVKSFTRTKKDGTVETVLLVDEGRALPYVRREAPKREEEVLISGGRNRLSQREGERSVDRGRTGRRARVETASDES